MLVKVCGLKQEANILEIDKYNPDFLGLIFYPFSQRYAGNSVIPKTKTPKVAVFVDETIENIIQITHKFNITYIQLHGNESPEILQQLHTMRFSIIKAFQIEDTIPNQYISQYTKYCQYILFDTKGLLPGGNSKKFNWDILKQYQLSTPFFLSGGITASDSTCVKQINHPYFAGIDINSGFEIEPGIKKIETIKQFINEIRY
jgi:phosphoribosylanthranilate isomerase